MKQLGIDGDAMRLCDVSLLQIARYGYGTPEMLVMQVRWGCRMSYCRPDVLAQVHYGKPTEYQTSKVKLYRSKAYRWGWKCRVVVRAPLTPWIQIESIPSIIIHDTELMAWGCSISH